MGRRTNIPGIFYSTPIQRDGRFLGAAVVKVDVPNIERTVSAKGAFVTDRHGVIILAGRSGLAAEGGAGCLGVFVTPTGTAAGLQARRHRAGAAGPRGADEPFPFRAGAAAMPVGAGRTAACRPKAWPPMCWPRSSGLATLRKRRHHACSCRLCRALCAASGAAACRSMMAQAIARVPEQSAGGQGAGRGRQPGEVRVPGDHEPRDPDADERRHRHDRPAARHRLNGEQRHSADTIRASAEALLSIINDILDFSRMEAGPARFRGHAVRDRPAGGGRAGYPGAAPGRQGDRSRQLCGAGRAGRLHGR